MAGPGRFAARSGKADALPDLFLRTCVRSWAWAWAPLCATAQLRLAQAVQAAQPVAIELAGRRHTIPALPLLHSLGVLVKSGSSACAACARSSFFNSKMPRSLHRAWHRPVRVRRLGQKRPDRTGRCRGRQPAVPADCPAAARPWPLWAGPALLLSLRPLYQYQYQYQYPYPCLCQAPPLEARVQAWGCCLEAARCPGTPCWPGCPRGRCLPPECAAR